MRKFAVAIVAILAFPGCMAITPRIEAPVPYGTSWTPTVCMRQAADALKAFKKIGYTGTILTYRIPDEVTAYGTRSGFGHVQYFVELTPGVLTPVNVGATTARVGVYDYVPEYLIMVPSWYTLADCGVRHGGWVSAGK